MLSLESIRGWSLGRARGKHVLCCQHCNRLPMYQHFRTCLPDVCMNSSRHRQAQSHSPARDVARMRRRRMRDPADMHKTHSSMCKQTPNGDLQHWVAYTSRPLSDPSQIVRCCSRATGQSQSSTSRPAFTWCGHGSSSLMRSLYACNLKTQIEFGEEEARRLQNTTRRSLPRNSTSVSRPSHTHWAPVVAKARSDSWYTSHERRRCGRGSGEHGTKTSQS
jgi:hypothetical protein